jgi:hypothetical protein
MSDEVFAVLLTCAFFAFCVLWVPLMDACAFIVRACLRPSATDFEMSGVEAKRLAVE